MALKRIAGGIKRAEGVGLKRIGGIEKKLPPLAEPEVANLTKGVDMDAVMDSSNPNRPIGEAVNKISDAWQKVRDARDREQKEKALQNDGAFYAVLVFDTREQKMAFLKSVNMASDGDIYIDGRELAQKLNGIFADIGARIKRLVSEKFHEHIDKITAPYTIKLPMVEMRMPKLFRVDKKMSAMAMGKGERG